MPGAIARAHHWPVGAVHARKGPPKSTASRAWGIRPAPAILDVDPDGHI